MIRALSFSVERDGRPSSRWGRSGVRVRAHPSEVQQSRSQVSAPGTHALEGIKRGTDWDRRDWAQPYLMGLQEQKDAVTIKVEGNVPPSLLGGTYYRNGPGLFLTGGMMVAHPFDGDGAICSIRFDGSHMAVFRARFVRTAEYVAEQQQKRRMGRGSFGTNIPGGQIFNALDVYPKNVANIGVLATGDRLLALFEGGQPHELDPETLETKGVTSLDGLLRCGAPFNVDWIGLSGVASLALSGIRRIRGLEPTNVPVGGDAFASHFRVDPKRGRFVCMSYQVAVEPHGSVHGFQTCLRFYEYNDKLEVLSVLNYDLHGYGYVHDFAITEDSIVLMLNPIDLHLQDYVFGKLGPIHCIKYDQKKRLKVIVIPRKLRTAHGGTVDAVENVFGWQSNLSKDLEEEAWRKKMLTFTLPPHFMQHLANAWVERVSPTQRQLNVTYVGYESMPDFFHWCGPGRNFLDVEPGMQPESRLMHATFLLPDEDIDSWSDGEAEHVTKRIQMSTCDFPAPPSTLIQPMSTDGRAPMKPYLKPSVHTGKLQSNVTCPNMEPHSVPSLSFTPKDGCGRNQWRQTGLRLGWPVAPPRPIVPPSVPLVDAGRTRLVCRRVLEFPKVNPKRIGRAARYVFGAAALHPHDNRPQQALAIYDIHTGSCEHWSRGWRYYVGEPEVVPSAEEHRRPDIHQELDSWVISICYDAERNVSEVVVLDASNISAGPVACAELPVVIPHGLHGAWMPAT